MPYSDDGAGVVIVLREKRPLIVVSRDKFG